MTLFDPRMIAAHEDRARHNFAAYDFLWRRIAGDLQDRLLDIRCDFPNAVEIGPFPMVLNETLCADKRITQLHHCMPDRVTGVLPLEPRSLDLIVSFNHLHWAGDLPLLLLQMQHALKPDGLLLLSMIGGETLCELRAALALAETETSGGASPRISPFVQLPDLAALLQAGGFALPVADHEHLTVTYPDVASLVRDIRGMGQSHAVAARRRAILKREFWPLVERRYREQFLLQSGKLPATVEVLYGLGWSPSSLQPQPLKRGSGKVSLRDVLELKNES